MQTAQMGLTQEAGSYGVDAAAARPARPMQGPLGRWSRGALLSGLAAALAFGTLGLGRTAGDVRAEDPPAAKAASKPSQEELEKKFAELLSKCVLVGRFTTDGTDDVKSPQEDRYEIAKAAKLKDDLWIFTGIKYGQSDIKLPLVLRVVWAGDTPVMTMDKFTIPTLGTFSFRIMFHGNRYAGTWQHDDHGGHMWGRVERALEKGEAKPESKPESKPGAKPESDKP